MKFKPLFSVFRPNLYLSVSKKSGDTGKDLRSQMVRKGNQFSFDGPTIIYCATKKSAENVADVVKGKFLTCFQFALIIITC